eukprot:181393_1
MMRLFTSVSLVITVIYICFYAFGSGQDNNTAVIYFISILEDETIGSFGTPGAEIAVDTINKNNSLLPYYNLSTEVLDSKGNVISALNHTLFIINQLNNNNHTIIPIIVGCPWSSHSVITAAAFATNQIGQISSGSTSTALSDTATYPTFFRTIPDDRLQALAIIKLCKKLNFNRIGIAYVNDNFGVYLVAVIRQYIELFYGYDTIAIDTQISYERNVPSSYNIVAEHIKKRNIFVTVLITHSGELFDIFNVFKNYSIDSYPYYYIGTSGWFDESIISENLTNFVEGYIGITPGGKTEYFNYIKNKLFYNNNLNTSIQINKYINDVWNEWYLIDKNLTYNNAFPGIYSGFGYDTVYAIAIALQQYHNKYNNTVLNETINYQQLINELKNVSFIGATGNVSFDDYNDRLQGLLFIGNVDINGTINPIGYIYSANNEYNHDEIVNNAYDNNSNDDDTFVFVLNENEIKYPLSFRSRGMQPRSNKQIHIKYIQIDSSALWVIFSWSILSIIIISIHLFFVFIYRKHEYMTAVKNTMVLNCITCVGCLLLLIMLIIKGFFEFDAFDNVNVQTSLCIGNFDVILLAITCIFVPLSLKMYNFYQATINNSNIGIKQIIITIVCVLIIDFIFIIISIVRSFDYTLVNGDLINYPDDPLQATQYKYGLCKWNGQNVAILYSFLSIIKVIPFLICVFLTIFINFQQELTNEPLEIKRQLICIFIIIIITITSGILLSAFYDVTFVYSVVGIAANLVSWVFVFMNITPYLYAIKYKPNDDYWQMTDINKIKDTQRQQGTSTDENSALFRQ